jgi:hypothetical protein
LSSNDVGMVSELCSNGVKMVFDCYSNSVQAVFLVLSFSVLQLCSKDVLSFCHCLQHKIAYILYQLKRNFGVLSQEKVICVAPVLLQH